MKWISVKEKLPGWRKEGSCPMVIVRMFDGEVAVGRMNPLASAWWVLCAGDDELDGPYALADITHWMPLPKPPKEDA